MKRISLGNRQWFDASAAEYWDEDKCWNGSNWISCATRSQWVHERLFLTRSGTYVLQEWSQWQGSKSTYTMIDRETAYRWLIAQRQADSVPDQRFLDLVAREMEAGKNDTGNI